MEVAHDHLRRLQRALCFKRTKKTNKVKAQGDRQTTLKITKYFSPASNLATLGEMIVVTMVGAMVGAIAPLKYFYSGIVMPYYNTTQTPSFFSL